MGRYGADLTFLRPFCTFSVPDAMAGKVDSGSGAQLPPPTEAEQRAKLGNDRKFRSYCEANPRCVAALPFLWKTVDSCCYGLEAMPTLQPFFADWGGQVKKAQRGTGTHRDQAAERSGLV